MKKGLILAVGVAAVVACVAAGQATNRTWPPIPPARPQGDIAVVAHPPAAVLQTIRHDCYNCHSDRPEVPWYGHVWPVSEQVQDDIHRAGARLNFSEWDQLSPEMARIRSLQVCMMVSSNKMPIWYYKPMHPGESVSRQEAAAICEWAHSLPQALTTQQALTQQQAQR